MKTARELAHEMAKCDGPGLYMNPDWDDETGGDRPLIDKEHSPGCDRLTAAIEAHDREQKAVRDNLAAALKVAQEALADAAPTVEIATALHRIWELTGTRP